MNDLPENILREFFQACCVSNDKEAYLPLLSDDFLLICPEMHTDCVGKEAAGSALNAFVKEQMPHGFAFTPMKTRDFDGVAYVCFRLSAVAGGLSDADISADAVVSKSTGNLRIELLHCGCGKSPRRGRAQRYVADERKKTLFALRKANVSYWEYDIKSNCIAGLIKNDNHPFEPYRIPDPAEHYIRQGDVHPDSESSLRSLYERIRNGEKEGTLDIKVLAYDGVNWTNQRIDFYTTFDSAGAPVRAICVEKNIDDVVLANARYDEVSRQYGSLESGCLFNCRIDLTHMRVEYSHCRSDLNVCAGSIDTFSPAPLEAQSMHLPENQRRMFIQLLTPAHMKDNFKFGKRNEQAEFRWHRDSGETLWVSVNVQTVANPQTDCIVAFLHIIDASEKKFWQTAVNVGTQMTCDFVAVIDAADGSVQRINADAPEAFPPGVIPCDYSRALRRFLEVAIPPAGRERARASMNLDSILRALETAPVYTHRNDIVTAAGTLETKEWMYRYFDDERRKIIYVRRSISNRNSGE